MSWWLGFEVSEVFYRFLGFWPLFSQQVSAKSDLGFQLSFFSGFFEVFEVLTPLETKTTNYWCSCYQKKSVNGNWQQLLPIPVNSSHTSLPCLIFCIFDVFDFFSCHSLYVDTSVVSKNLPVPPTLHINTPNQPNIPGITSVTWQNRFRVFTGFGSCQGFRKPGKEKSKGLSSQGLVNVYILHYLGSRFPTKDT